MNPIKIIQIGLGPIGQKITRYFLARKNDFRIVGAVDIDPAKIGRDLGEVCGLSQRMGLPVTGCLEDALRKHRPQVAVLTTLSDMQRITPQIEAIVARGLHVVSSCEELLFPWQTAPRLARRLDSAAKKNRVAVLGTGVNPGFLMDFLPVVLTGVCQRVDHIKVARIQNAAFRRVPFQKKIGAGLTLKEFAARQKAGTLRHVGLTESIGMIAHRMEWPLSRTEDVLTPIIAPKNMRTRTLVIKRGMAAGVQQIGRGFVGRAARITLVFRAAIGEPDPHDTIEIKGEPNIVSSIKGGVNGDVASCAMIINAARLILRANPGLRTMTDIYVPSFFANSSARPPTALERSPPRRMANNTG